jgi:hypothetical protein
MIERTPAWLIRFRRVTVPNERRADSRRAFLLLSCALICRLKSSPARVLWMPIVGDLIHVLLHLFYTHELLTLFVALLIEEAGIPMPIPGGHVANADRRGAAQNDLVGCDGRLRLRSGGLHRLVPAVQQPARGGRPFLLKYGRYLHINQRTLGRVEQWFRRHGRKPIIIGMGRLIPGLRLPTPIVAGISGLPPREWLITAAIAAPTWSAIYYVLGALLGRQAPLVIAYGADLLDDLPKELLAASALLVLIGLALDAYRLRRQRHHVRVAA